MQNSVDFFPVVSFKLESQSCFRTTMYIQEDGRIRRVKCPYEELLDTSKLKHH